jgi:hypothetical protein
MGIVDVTNVSEDVTNIVDFLDEVLQRIVNTLESFNIPVPARQYWTVGQPAIDCEQLVVSLVQIYLGPPGDQASSPQRCTQPRTAVMTVVLSREIPTVGQNGRAPSADKINAAAKISAIDAYALMRVINEFDVWEPGGYGVGVIATADIADPEGGFQSVNLQLTMAIP